MTSSMGPLVLLLAGLGPAWAGEMPADVARQVPPGFMMLGSAAPAFGRNVFTVVALGQVGEVANGLHPTPAQPSLLFKLRPDGSFQCP